MSKMNTQFNVPAYITEFKASEDGRYSVGKLKVFYIGTTADNRVFTKDFSDKLIKTLPSTPVVAYYSEDKDDFIGHNNIQYSYGHVPENATIEYVEDEDGVTFAETQVILYTAREDNIGEIANKIVGKQHSLELNPKTIKYDVVFEGNKVNKIVFKEGEFIGLSVLGDDQKPAFSGSCFKPLDEDSDSDNFSIQDTKKLNNYLTFLSERGEGMDKLNNYNEFLQHTYNETCSIIANAVDSLEGYNFMLDFNDSVVYYYDYENNKAYRATYAIADGNCTLGDATEVFRRYYTQEEIDKIEGNADATITEAAKTDEDEDNKKEEDENPAPTEDPKKDDDADNDDEDDKEKDKNKATVITEAAAIEEPQVEEVVVAEEGNANVEEENKEEVGKAAADTGFAALSDSDQAELEQFRREKKMNLLSSYAGDITEDVINDYKEHIDDFSYSDLEAKLAIEFRKSIVTYAQKEHKADFSILGLITQPKEEKEDHYDPRNPSDVLDRLNKKN